jgi:hypothetical protein
MVAAVMLVMPPVSKGGGPVKSGCAGPPPHESTQKKKKQIFRRHPECFEPATICWRCGRAPANSDPADLLVATLGKAYGVNHPGGNLNDLCVGCGPPEIIEAVKCVEGRIERLVCVVVLCWMKTADDGHEPRGTLDVYRPGGGPKPMHFRSFWEFALYRAANAQSTAHDIIVSL